MLHCRGEGEQLAHAQPLKLCGPCSGVPAREERDQETPRVVSTCELKQCCVAMGGQDLDKIPWQALHAEFFTLQAFGKCASLHSLTSIVLLFLEAQTGLHLKHHSLRSKLRCTCKSHNHRNIIEQFLLYLGRLHPQHPHLLVGLCWVAMSRPMRRPGLL